jgi:ribonuclease Z
MSITYQVLGGPSKDNALLVRVDSGQKIEYLLFDCGEGCLEKVPIRTVQEIDHLFFSHLHMDHIAGFDSFSGPTIAVKPSPIISGVHHKLQK